MQSIRRILLLSIFTSAFVFSAAQAHLIIEDKRPLRQEYIDTACPTDIAYENDLVYINSPCDRTLHILSVDFDRNSGGPSSTSSLKTADRFFYLDSFKYFNDEHKFQESSIEKDVVQEASELIIDGDRAYIMSQTSEIFVLDISNPRDVKKISIIDLQSFDALNEMLNSRAYHTVLRDDILYQLRADRLYAIDVKDPAHAKVLDIMSNVYQGGSAKDFQFGKQILLKDNFAIISYEHETTVEACSFDWDKLKRGFSIVDISNPETLIELGNYELDQTAVSWIQDDKNPNRAYALLQETTDDEFKYSLASFDITDPLNIKEIYRLDLNNLYVEHDFGFKFTMKSSNSRLYLSNQDKHTILSFNTSDNEIKLVDFIKKATTHAGSASLYHVADLAIANEDNFFAISRDTEQSLTLLQDKRYFDDIELANVRRLSPQHESYGIQKNASLTLSFDKPVLPGNGYVRILRGSKFSIADREFRGMKDGLYYYEGAGYIVEDTILMGTKDHIRLSGSVLTITPRKPLKEGEKYFIQVESSIALNKNNRKTFIGLAPKEWSFTVGKDTNPPRLDELTEFLVSLPGEFSAICNRGFSFDFLFNEGIKKGSGNIKIFNLETDELLETIDVNSPQVLANKSGFARIVQTEFIRHGTKIYIKVDPGAFQDLTGNDFEGVNSNTLTKTIDRSVFSSLYLTKQVGSYFNEDENSKKVFYIDGSLFFKFNRQVFRRPGKISIYDAETNELFEEIDTLSNRVKIYGPDYHSIEVIPEKEFPENREMYARFSLFSFTDSDATIFVDTGKHYFTTSTKISRFDLLTATPFLYKEDVPVQKGEEFELFFNKNIQLNTEGEIQITDLVSGEKVETIEIDSPRIDYYNNFLKFTPKQDLSKLQRYRIDFTEDFVKAAESFESAHIVPLKYLGLNDGRLMKIKELVPESGMKNFAINKLWFEIIFDDITEGEEIKFDNSKEIQILDQVKNEIVDRIPLKPPYVRQEGNRLLFRVTQELTGLHLASVIIEEGAFYLDPINAVDKRKIFPGIGKLGQMTWIVFPKYIDQKDYPLEITRFLPAKNSIEDKFRDNFQLRFNKEIVKGSGFIKIYNLKDHKLIEQIDIKSNAVVIENDINLIIDHSKDLSSHKSIYVTLDPGALLDLKGKQFSGIREEEWTFSQSLSSGPSGPLLEARSFFPATGQEEVVLGEDLQITFTDKIFLGESGLIKIKDFKTGNLLEQIDIKSNKVNLIDKTVYIDYRDIITPGAKVYVEVSQGAFKNAIGHEFIGVEAKKWFFTFQNDRVNSLDIIEYLPPPGSDLDETDIELVAKFNDNILPNKGYITILESKSGRIRRFIHVSHSKNYTIAGNEIRIPIEKAWRTIPRLHVLITPGAFVNKEGLKFKGITSPDEWYFIHQNNEGNDDDDDDPSGGPGDGDDGEGPSDGDDGEGPSDGDDGDDPNGGDDPNDGGEEEAPGGGNPSDEPGGVEPIDEGPVVPSRGNIFINAPDRLYFGNKAKRFKYSLERSNPQTATSCQLSYVGIGQKTRTIFFKKRQSYRKAFYRLSKKEIKRNKRNGSINFTINVSCSDGSSDSEDVTVYLR